MKMDFDFRSSNLLEDVTIIYPSVHKEDRGSIWTSYLNKKIDKFLPDDLVFLHDKFSESKKNVLRGIHGDHKSWKLISCISGKIFQVIVDLRKSSSSFLKHETFRLNSNEKKMILIPPGMGNAFLTISENATYHYKLAYKGDYIDAADQFTVAWDDPRLNIDWPIKKPILSSRDLQINNGSN
tara:strand:+ start:2763 stop:3308 length:546 start_codon:yes stop_codon:yes gene_type:complete